MKNSVYICNVIKKESQTKKLKRMKKQNYTLVGVESNAFSVMGYVKKALQDTNNNDLVNEYLEKAKSGDYNNLLATSMQYLDVCNGIKSEYKTTEVPNDYTAKYWDNKGDHQKEWDELTEKLVPDMGAGDTVNVELVRGANRLYYDLFNNGNGNVVECEQVEVEYEDEDGEYYTEYEDGDAYMNEYYEKFFDLMDECGIIDEVEGFREAVLTTDDFSPRNQYRYDTLINKVYEYVTTHADQELPSWYEKE